jgi:Ca2+-binding EF-hand superfamily protein
VTKELPDLRSDPHAWFSASDVLGDGRLSRSEAINVLLSQFPLDVGVFNREMERRWPGFDTDGDGYVTREEFFRPNSV